MENLLSWYNQPCEEAGFNRLGVKAFMLLVQTCVIVPATLLTISMNGNNAIEFAIMAILSFSILVSLLADMPSKVILPLFAFSTIVHLLINFNKCVLNEKSACGPYRSQLFLDPLGVGLPAKRLTGLKG